MSKYKNRGVSADKEDVHEAIKHLDKGLYPYAFCKILPDFITNDEAYCTLMHADTAGTKPSLAYMFWDVTGDYSVWEGVVQDAIVMNIDDMACVGCSNDIYLCNTIGRNKNKITGQILNQIINFVPKFSENLAKLGVNLHLAGGETADVGDIVRTCDIGFTAFARMKRNDIIENAIRPGQIIIGLASYGQATYEHEYNSGIGSNGLTMARHELLHHSYALKYQDTFDLNIGLENVYNGQYYLDDEIYVDGKNYYLGKLLLSPTRTYLPLLKIIFEKHKSSIKGIIHNTGGGASKVLNYLRENVNIVKDNMLPIPPIFKLIQGASNSDFFEMFKVFNMGTRLEIYVETEQVAQKIIEAANSFHIDAQIIGHTTASDIKEVNVMHESSQIHYSK